MIERWTRWVTEDEHYDPETEHLIHTVSLLTLYLILVVTFGVGLLLFVGAFQ